MKYFIYDTKSLTYKSVPHPVYNGTFLMRYIAITLLFGLCMIVLGRWMGQQDVQEPSQKELKVIIQESDPFTEEKLVAYLKDLNIKYPEIVYAQAVLETGNFKSEVFLQNHNLFGMREALIRPTTNCGTNLNHATYAHWRESVLDYALYQASYLYEIRSADEYYAYLFQHYAEDKTYVDKIKTIAEQEDTRASFS